MKKSLILGVLFLVISFFLSGLQGSFYFFPLSMPFFWIVILTYYSFRKSLIFSLVTNLAHLFVITAFTSVELSQLLVLMNLISLGFYLLRERFHTNQWYLTAGSAAACFLIFLINWLYSLASYGFYYPNFFRWISVSLMTLLIAPPLLFILEKLDQRIHHERIDTLANLRI